MNHHNSYHAKTFKGLERILARELEDLGAENISIGNRGVDFSGGKSMLYKTNFCLRTALRILVPWFSYRAQNENQLYKEIRKIDWSQVLDVHKTFMIDPVVFSSIFRNSQYVALRIKDAIVDQFRSETGLRPSVDRNQPDLRINVHVNQDRFLISLDSSGDPLFKRGYRKNAHAAPLNEVLAAGMILLTGWNGQKPFIDPMCGSGTLAIEAALIAAGIPPGVFRKGFAFEKWKDYDNNLFTRVIETLPQEKRLQVPIYAFDIDEASTKLARDNILSAELQDYISVEKRDFLTPEEVFSPSVMVINPPYGERIGGAEIQMLYKRIGDALKKSYPGSEAWILSASKEGMKQLGLKAERKITLYNGALECKYQKFRLFDGTFKEYKKNSAQ